MNAKIKKFFSVKNIVIISIIAALLITVIIVTAVMGREKTYNFSKAYDFYKENVIKDASVGDGVVLTETEMNGANKEVVSGAEAGYEGGNVVKLQADSALNNKVNMSFNLAQGGSYFVKVEYKILSNAKYDHAVSLKVNGGEEKIEYTSMPLPSLFKNESDDFATDRLGNEAYPLQVSLEGYFSCYLNDSEKKNELAQPVGFVEGGNTLELSLSSGIIYLARVSIVAPPSIKSYAQYKAIGGRAQNRTEGKSIIIEAEKPASKNSLSIMPDTISDINITPYHTYKKLLNTIGTAQSGEEITYEFTVPEDGFYKIGFNYVTGFTAFRKILIDGKVLFGELMHYPFKPTDNAEITTLGRDGEDFKVHLSGGVHTITVANDGAIMAAINGKLQATSKELSEYYLSLKKLVGPNPDKDRDWNVLEYFPEIVNDFNGYIGIINEQIELYKQFNGTSSQDSNIVILETAISTLKKLLKKPNLIPNNIALISEGSSSVVQSLSSMILEISYNFMGIDRIFVTSADAQHSYEHRSGFVKFWESVKFFFYSFSGNFSIEKDDNTIEIWVNRTMQNISLIQRMADSDFTKKTGIKVRISMLKEEGKLILANSSGINPDGVIGIANHIPYEMGLRGLVYDMRDMPGITDTLKSFSPGSMLPLIVDGEVWALPETQDATMLFYRKDILQSLGLTPPDTWEEVQKMLPVLQRNGMNFYIPTSNNVAAKPLAATAPFIYQSGGDIYSDDAMTTAIDSKEAIEGFKRLTDLYTKYSLPQQVTSFPESFRDGSIPVGFGTLSVYAQLLVSAPELVGRWDMVPVPGMKNAEGVTERWYGGGSTVCSIMKKSKHPEKVWEFIRWWMSTDVQSSYADQCQAIWGNQFIWASANVDAFKSSAYDAKHKQSVIEQWQWLLEFPKVPGWYMIERELSNAWNTVVMDGTNPRWAIDNAAKTANKEISRKMHEFGYMKNNQVVKPYKVTTLEEVIEWIGQ